MQTQSSLSSAAPRIQAQYSDSTYEAIIAAIKDGGKTSDLAKQFKVSGSTVRRIARTIKGFETFELSLTDGVTTVSVAAVTTCQGFEHACRFAMKQFHGFFDGLMLPQWRLVSGSHQAKLTDLRVGLKEEV